MAKRTHEAIGKRARERARLEKQEAKRERRQSRSREAAAPVTLDEAALMEEFAQLSAQYETKQIGEVEYAEKRRRILDQLGIEAY